MKPPPATDSRKDSFIAAIGVLVLLLGAATANAWAMLAMSVVALAVMVALYRRGPGRNMIRAIIVAAATAFVVAFAISRL
jgi:hypothetical protein